VKPLVAFHGNAAEKDAILAQLQLHYDADEIVHGIYWEKGKGCAVGCTIHSDDHAEYEPRFGIPQALARLEDTIFEGMTNGNSKEWPLRFMRAIPVGADLSHVQWQFLHWLLTDEKANPGINHPLVKDAVSRVATMMAALAKGDDVPESAARSAARSAAQSAAQSAAESAWSARSAAESAAWSAESAAQSAAESAAWSAAESAVRSAAESAVRSAARSAESAAQSARSARSARSAAYSLMADKLVAFLEAAPQAVAA
jgi:hypothetical protein